MGVLWDNTHTHTPSVMYSICVQTKTRSLSQRVLISALTESLYQCHQVCVFDMKRQNTLWGHDLNSTFHDLRPLGPDTRWSLWGWVITAELLKPAETFDFGPNVCLKENLLTSRIKLWKRIFYLFKGVFLWAAYNKRLSSYTVHFPPLGGAVLCLTHASLMWRFCRGRPDAGGGDHDRNGFHRRFLRCHVGPLWSHYCSHRAAQRSEPQVFIKLWSG